MPPVPYDIFDTNQRKKTDLKIASINIRGLGDKVKRQETFKWLREKKYSIFFVQEAHCSDSSMHDWRAEWGYQALFSCCSSKKAGVAILFNNNFAFQISKSYVDPEGRFVICDLNSSGKQITLANIYAPNDDNPNFFTTFFEHLTDFNCEDIIVGGDFNLVLDVEKDKKGGLARTHYKSLEVINNFSENLDLVDVWRALNPNSLRYTWRQRKPEIHCRLDFFLISQCTLCNTINADILPGYKTDHSMITLHISLHSNTRGRGFWKLNTSFLSDKNYVDQIKSVIVKTKEEYEKDDTVDPNLLWEMIKMKVREASMKYGATKKRNLGSKQIEVEKKIKVLEGQLADTLSDGEQKERNWTELETKRRELETISKQKVRF